MLQGHVNQQHVCRLLLPNQIQLLVESPDPQTLSLRFSRDTRFEESDYNSKPNKQILPINVPNTFNLLSGFNICNIRTKQKVPKEKKLLRYRRRMYTNQSLTLNKFATVPGPNRLKLTIKRYQLESLTLFQCCGTGNGTGTVGTVTF